MYQYDEELLKRLQKTELEVLKTFDAVCRKYNITYFVAFGTAIGAVRHNGFIPWDDDIDVGMMREDYEKLRQVPTEEWGDLFLGDPSDENGIHRMIFPKLYKKNTVFETEFLSTHCIDVYKQEGEQTPVWIDIFVFDRVASQVSLKKKMMRKWLLGKLYFYSKCKFASVRGDALLIKLLCAIKRYTHYVLHLLKFTPNQIHRLFLKNIGDEDGAYVTSYEVSYSKEIKQLFCKYDDMFPVKEIPFENGTVYIQKNYHEALTSLYGDYMILPPEEKRQNHPPEILILED